MAEITPDIVHVGTVINIGAGVTKSTSNGNIVAGDGSNEFKWNASAGELSAGAPAGVEMVYDQGSGSNGALKIRDSANATVVRLSGSGYVRVGTDAGGGTGDASSFGDISGGSSGAGQFHYDASVNTIKLSGIAGAIDHATGTISIGASTAAGLILGRPTIGLSAPGWVNVGATTSATALGDIAAGDGTRSMFYDASTSALAVTAVGNDFSTVNVNTGLGALALSGLNLNTDIGGTVRGGSLQAFSSTWTASGGYDIPSSFGINSSLNATGGLVLSTFGNAPIRFFTNGTSGAERWQITSAGMFVAPTDNTYDIGASGATRPRNVYVAGNVVAGGTITGTGAGALSFLNVGSATDAVSTGDLAAGTAASGGLFYDASAVTLTIGSSITIGSAAIDASAAMAIGGTTATSIAIGRSGVTTDFPSGSTVDFTGATVTGFPTPSHSFLNVGTTISATAAGDLAAGAPAANTMSWDQSAGTLTITPDGNQATSPWVQLNALGVVWVSRESVPGSVVGVLSLDTCGGFGTAGTGTSASFIVPNSGGECNAVGRISTVLRQATNGATYADYVWEAALDQATTELIETFRVGNSQAAAGIHRVEVPGGGLQVGNISATQAAAGDIVASDGTREMFWDASAGTLQVGAGVNALLSIFVNNTSAGTGAASRVIALNDTGGAMQMLASSSGNTAILPQRANAGTLSTDSTFTGGLIINTNAVDAPIEFMTAATSRWQIMGGTTGGHLRATTDNTTDIGASGATRPRTGYFGTSVVVGSTITIATASIDASGALAIGGTSATSLAIGRSGVTTDFPSGSTVDFTGATVTGFPTPAHSFLNVGTATAAVASGDLAAGSPTGNSMIWDQSAGTLRIGDPTALPVVNINAVGAVTISRAHVAGTATGVLVLQTCAGFGIDGSGVGTAWVAPNSAGECNTIARTDALYRQATNGNSYVDWRLESARAQATTELIETFRVGNSQAAAGIHRVEVPGGGLQVGTVSATGQAEAGDIVASDGTREMFWNASAGSLTVATSVIIGSTVTITTDSIDASGALTIGGTNATSLAIGRSGVTTDFPSGSTVDFTGATVTGLPAGSSSGKLLKRTVISSSSVSANLGAATVQSPTSIPTTSTGTQVLSNSYTPLLSGSIVKVTAVTLTASGGARDVIGSVFQGSTCIGATGDRSQGGGSGFLVITTMGSFTTVSTSAVTISSRIALDATQTNFRVNGNSTGTTAFGAAAKTFLVIEEYDPT